MNQTAEDNFSKITVDYRETASGLVDLLKNTGAVVDIKRIPCGDYVINEDVFIERKTAKDFLVSIIDGRLFSQLSNLKKTCGNPMLLIEGNPYRTDLKFDRLAIRGAMISTSSIWYVPVLFSRDKEDSCDMLITMSKQIKAHIDVALSRSGYRPKRLKSKQLYILQGLPQIGPVLAKRLIQHFKSVSNVMNASIFPDRINRIFRIFYSVSGRNRVNSIAFGESMRFQSITMV